MDKTDKVYCKNCRWIGDSFGFCGHYYACYHESNINVINTDDCMEPSSRTDHKEHARTINCNNDCINYQYLPRIHKVLNVLKKWLKISNR